MDIIKIICLAVIKERKLLVVRHHKNKEVFYQLGGKPKDNETDTECLIREVKEEINANIQKDTLKFLHEFKNEAFDKKNTRVNIRLYKANIKHEPQPSSEIAEIKYFDSTIEKRYLT